jgi:phage gp36-like protein
MKAYIELNSNTLLLDFERPVLFNPNVVFKVNDQTAVVGSGPTTDTLRVDGGLLADSDLTDLWVSYEPDPLVPLLYLSGPASDRLVKAFEIPVLITNRTDTLATDVNNTNSSPLISDFIDAYGYQETVTITNPENALAQSPDEYRLIRALEDAEALYNSYLLNEAAANNAIVIAGKRRTILTFARYFLDSRCRRKVVTEDYNNAVLALELAADSVVIQPGTDLYDGSELAYSSQTCCPQTNCCGH